jgi:hypothetical protein
MTIYPGLLAALVVALLLTVISVAIGRRGPWGASWAFFLVLFLALWMVAIYIPAAGPVYLGIAWLPIIIAGILLALLLAAAIPDVNHWRDESIRDTETSKVTGLDNKPDIRQTRIGRFFWILILLMVAAIIIGMTNPQPAL